MDNRSGRVIRSSVRNGYAGMDTKDERLTIRGPGMYDFPSLEGKEGVDYVVVALPAAMGLKG